MAEGNQIPVTIPRLGESITEATLLRWIKNEGDNVQQDEPLCELETDKATVELPAPVSGVLHQTKQAGQSVKIGDSVASIEPGDVRATAKAAPAASTASVPPAAPEPSEAHAAKGLSPSVRRLAAEHHLDLSQVEPSGPRGRLTKADVLSFIQGQEAPGSRTSQEAAPKPVAPPPPQAPLYRSSPGSREARRVPMTSIRKRIAERLVKVQNEAAILTTFNEVDMTAINRLRGQYKERFEKVYGVGLGFMSFFARAVVVALKEFPILNAFIEGSDIVYHDYVDLGIAVSTDRGLMVPVVRGADGLSFAGIESGIRRLATLGRDGKLGLDDLSGGTFSITNGGIFGSLLSTPLLNPPQTGILGMHAIVDRPKAMPGGQIEVRPMMYLALSYDHRLVDGKDSVRFLVRVKECLEDPARLMLEV